MACPDFNSNGVVDADDVTLVASHWLNHSGAAGWNVVYDLDGDGGIDPLSFPVQHAHMRHIDEFTNELNELLRTRE